MGGHYNYYGQQLFLYTFTKIYFRDYLVYLFEQFHTCNSTLQAPVVEPMWYLCESVMLGSRGETCCNV